MLWLVEFHRYPHENMRIVPHDVSQVFLLVEQNPGGNRGGLCVEFLDGRFVDLAQGDELLVLKDFEPIDLPPSHRPGRGLCFSGRFEEEQKGLKGKTARTANPVQTTGFSYAVSRQGMFHQ